jgi:aspartyl-tRNA(Asn)/glutamyl-tRNA(Gln) amidotransferase subunit A
MDHLTSLSIYEASELLKSKCISPVELLNAHLEIIHKKEPILNSFITILEKQSQDSALIAEKEILENKIKSRLHGIPIGLKDLYFTKVIKTTIGSSIHKDFIPEYDSAVTEKLSDSGAIIIGKMQMHEFALGTTSINEHHGTSKNPWNPQHVTGGSSGGSASSVASGQVMGAMGSDTGGSIRIPSAACGIVGLKPTFGRVSRYGVFPLSWSLDTVGPMTRTTIDSAIMMNSIAGYDSRDSSSINVKTDDYLIKINDGIKGLRIGVPTNFFYSVIDPEVEKSVKNASRKLSDLGAEVEEFSLPVLEHSLAISSIILLTEAAEIHLENMRNNSAKMGVDVLERLRQGLILSGTDYVSALRARTEFNQEIDLALQKYDVLLSPTLAIGAPKITEDLITIGDTTLSTSSLMSRLTRPFNVTGLPTISIPCGLTSSKMPIGLQLTSKAFQESTILKTAQAYEREVGFPKIA